jgi:hypothetical protein
VTKMRAQLAAKTTGSMIRTDRLVEAPKTAEDGSHIQPEPGPSGGRGSHAEVKSSKKEGRF